MLPWKIIAPHSKDMAVHTVLLPGGNRGKILHFGEYRADNITSSM